MIFLCTLIGFLIIFLVILTFILLKTLPKPENSPEKYLKAIEKNKNFFAKKKLPQRNKRKIFVCIGDSITHGKVGVNYVDIIEKKVKKEIDENFVFINAGINNEHAYNVLMRIDEIIACKPDFISLLIGTNDAHRSFITKQTFTQKFMLRLLQLPQAASLQFFEKSLYEIIEKLKQKTNAEIAIFSIPTIGEEITHPIYEYTLRFKDSIKKIAGEFDLYYIPLFEKMDKFLRQTIREEKLNLRGYSKPFGLMVKSLIRKHILNQDFDYISQKHGFLLHIDQLHLNSISVKMICRELYNFILNKVDFNSTFIKSKLK